MIDAEDGQATPRERARVVVVGAGLGGLRTVERLRQRGHTGEIVLLGAERHLPYDRPPLSKQLLRGEIEDSSLRLAEDFAELGVDVRLDDPATGLDVSGQAVLTRDGELGYDVAVIATGAVPRRIPGLGGRVLRTFDDAVALQADLGPGRRLAVVGAGLVGCEVAASARAMGAEVSLIDVLPAPMVRVLGPRAAHLVAELHAAHGVELRFGVGVEGFAAGRLRLDDGTEIAADVVLEAIGVVPDTGWLAGGEVPVDDGVVCDMHGKAAPRVFAVGDVARWAGRRHEHWTNVGFQADRVAAAILGQDHVAVDVAYWWSDQYDVKLQGLGLPDAGDAVEVLVWGPKARTIVVYSRDGRLTGLVGFSAAGGIMRLRADVAAGTDVSDVLARLRG